VGLSIAVAGKGGMGKTTFCSLLVRALREAELRPVLAVDADPNSNLAESLGVESGRTLADIRDQGASPEGSPASGLGRARAVEDEIQRALVEDEGFDLITMGRPEGPRCYCYVNSLLRKTVDGLATNYKAVLIDNEAGMEHLSRRTTNDVDCLIAVMDPTRPGFRAVQRVVALSRELPIRIARRLVIVNRVRPGTADPFAAELKALGPDVERLPDVPQDDAVERAGAAGEPVFRLEASSPALAAVKRIVDKLKPAS
jgi:CO dehydrogenase maturation factor